VSKHQTPQRQLAEEERRRLELDQLVQLLTETAIDAATDQKVKFTDEKRAQLRRQSDILSGAVGELVKVLTDHPRALVREYRLTKLFEALGSSAFIASYVIKNKTLDKLRPARATEKRLEKVRKPEVTNILCEQFDIFRKQHPDWKPNTPRRGAHYVAKCLYDQVNNRVTKLIRVKKKSPGLKRDTIARYLKEQCPDLFKSD
jgi:hypothetical protein